MLNNRRRNRKQKSTISTESESPPERSRSDGYAFELRGHKSLAEERLQIWDCRDTPITNYIDVPEGWSKEEPGLHGNSVLQYLSMLK